MKFVVYQEVNQAMPFHEFNVVTFNQQNKREPLKTAVYKKAHTG